MCSPKVQLAFVLMLTCLSHCSAGQTAPAEGKVYVGYQGWFNTEGDGMGVGFRHYTLEDYYAPGAATVEMWPDMSELSESERFDTGFKHADGSVAQVFSSAHPKTVLRHFQWMAEHQIDGAFLQRFPVSLKRGANYQVALNQVLSNVRAASSTTQVQWALMYDLSGLKRGEISTILLPDLKRLLASGITRDPHYIKHNGKPLISIWGAGFKNRDYQLNEVAQLVSFLKNSEFGQHAVMLGVPYRWRTLGEDSNGEKALHQLIKQADIVSPWAVGRYRSPADMPTIKKQALIPDQAWLQAKQIDYLPVIFPGFSWKNLKATRGVATDFNQIPRLGGQFLWSQAIAAKQSGANMLYIAMFDEIDEGTAIFKVSNNPPLGQTQFLTYEGLPADHYLWLTRQIKKMLSGELGVTESMPALPQHQLIQSKGRK